MRNKRLILFVLLSVIVAVAPIANWHVDDVELIKGIVWRLTMLSTFVIGLHWNTKGAILFPKKKTLTKN